MRHNILNLFINKCNNVFIIMIMIILFSFISINRFSGKFICQYLTNEIKDIANCFNTTKKVTCTRKSNELYIKKRIGNPYILLLNEYSHNDIKLQNIKKCDYLVTIITEPNMFYERSTFRRIYKKYNFILYVFVTGKSNNSYVNDEIRKEIIMYNDILQFDFYSSYYALQLQTYNIIVWCSKIHIHFKWLIKHDTDTFFNIFVLKELHKLHKNNSESDIWGYIIGYFPSGMGYVIPHKLINKLINATYPEINLNCYGKAEDVFIGRIAKKSNIDLFDIRRLKKNIDEGNCTIDKIDNYFMIHRLKPSEIYYLHTQYI